MILTLTNVLSSYCVIRALYPPSPSAFVAIGTNQQQFVATIVTAVLLQELETDSSLIYSYFGIGLFVQHLSTFSRLVWRSDNRGGICTNTSVHSWSCRRRNAFDVYREEMRFRYRHVTVKHAIFAVTCCYVAYVCRWPKFRDIFFPVFGSYLIITNEMHTFYSKVLI
jgi:hypothetical protein